MVHETKPLTECWKDCPTTASTASIVIEVLLTLVNQYLFTALGIVLLIALTHQVGALDSVLIALAASLPLPFGLFMWKISFQLSVCGSKTICRKVMYVSR